MIGHPRLTTACTRPAISELLIIKGSSGRVMPGVRLLYLEILGMEHVFISYSRDDAFFAELMRKTITDYGLNVWMDRSRLHGGMDWRGEIEQAIRDALLLVVIMSPAAKQSEYVTYEWAFALGAKVKIIPILHKATELNPRLAGLQHLDFSSYEATRWYDLIKVIRLEQIKILLHDEGYTWRTIKTLAETLKVTENDVLSIIGNERDIVISRDRTKAKLRVR